MFRKQDTYSTYKPPFQETDEKIKDLEKQSERLWNIQDNLSDYSTKKKVRELTNTDSQFMTAGLISYFLGKK